MDMKIGELEDLFERYRGRQDLRALGKLFDLAAPELLRLSVHMAPDVSSAEDLVQQTFLVAIEKPQRWRAGEPLLPWLFGILSKLAKKQRRHARRTPEADRLAPRASEDPAHVLLSAELQSAVRSALESLPELYREVVRASLFEEKPPQEIARELERAPGTVRMQLLRGLELLRRALPGGVAGGALLLCGTRGEAAVKAAVLEKGAAHAALAAGSAALGTSTLTLGGLLVSTKVVLVVLVMAMGLCSYLLWPRTPAAGEIVGYALDTMGNPLVERADGRGGSRTEPLRAEAPEAERSAVAPEPAAAPAVVAPRVFLVGKLLDVDPRFAGEIELEVSIAGRGQVKGKSRPDASFEVDLGALFGTQSIEVAFGGERRTVELSTPGPGPATATIDVWARHPRYISERVVVPVPKDLLAPGGTARREITCEIRMRRASVVTGIVRVPAGWNVEEADVALHGLTQERDDGLLFGLEHSNCDAQGRYTIKSLRSGRLYVQAELQGLLPVAANVELEAGGLLELPDIVLEQGSASIRGRVDLPPGLEQRQTGSMDSGSGPVAVFGRSLRIQAHRVAPEAGGPSPSGASGPAPGGAGGIVLDPRSVRPVRELRGGARLEAQSCDVAGDGSFELRGLEPGRWTLSIEGMGGQGVLPGYEWPVFVAPADGVLLGENLGSIVVHVGDAKGPVAGALVTLMSENSATTYVAGSDGDVRVAGDLRTDYRGSVTAQGRDRVALELLALGRAREARIEVVLADAAPAARLVLHAPKAGTPPRLVQVDLTSLENPPAQQHSESVALAEGRYVLENLQPGRWKIRVGPSEDQIPAAFYGGYLQSEIFEAELVPGGTFERVLRCEIGGRVQFTVSADASLKSNGIGCALRSLDGAEVAPPVFVCALSGEGFGVFGSSDYLMIMGEHTQVAFQDCLAPGHYELRVTSSSVRAEPLLFEIKAGETTQTVWKIDK